MVSGRDVHLGSKMTRLPIVYIQQSGIQRLASRGFKLDHSGRESTQISVRDFPGFTAYESIPHCKTCGRFSVLGYDARCAHEPNRHVPVDGSGYCHEHSELKEKQ